MKRISYAAMSTLTALVLLFGYRTSTSSHAASGSVIAIGGSVPSSAAATSSAAPTPSPTSTAIAPTGSSSSAAAKAAAAKAAAAKAAAAKAAASKAAAAKASASKTVTGTAADTQYGPVQVELTVAGGKVTNVSVVEYPNNDGRDAQINSYALPILISETLKAQSAKIDSVSGATYTSGGYLTSLQSALDQAGI